MREFKRNPDARSFNFTANKALTDKIVDLATARHRSFSNIIRMFLWLGIEKYEINQLSGNDTKKKREQAAELERAQAEAKAARKNVTNVTKTTPISILFGVDAPDE